MLTTETRHTHTHSQTLALALDHKLTYVAMEHFTSDNIITNACYYLIELIVMVHCWPIRYQDTDFVPAIH